VTSVKYSTNLGGLAGADTICMDHARAAGLQGPFVAWLSTSTTDAVTRLVVPGTSKPARGWVRTDGKPIADTVADLIIGRFYYPIRLDERGTDLALQSHDVMSGTTRAGVFDDSSSQCLDWTTNGPGESYSIGNLARTFVDWTGNYSADCSTLTARIYCLGIAYDNALSFTPSTGRIAFVSKTPFVTSAGGDAADGMCAMEAQGAGLPGTFLAALATEQRSATSRFDPLPGPWIRTDGVPLADTGQRVLDFRLDATLNLDARGTHGIDYVWIGSTDPTALSVPSDDCQNWTTSAMAQSALIGKSTSSTSAINDGNAPCDQQNHVYCFEQ